jgi:hypothetical protein
MLHNPYCSPSTSRAAKTSGVNYIPPSLVITWPKAAERHDKVSRDLPAGAL